jgi:hypothetical protein
MYRSQSTKGHHPVERPPFGFTGDQDEGSFQSSLYSWIRCLGGVVQVAHHGWLGEQTTDQTASGCTLVPIAAYRCNSESENEAR